MNIALGIIPTVGMLGGIPFMNRERPLILGLPPILAWIVAWVLITSALMGILFLIDRRAKS